MAVGQAFRTGASSRAYTLTGIELRLVYAGSDTLPVVTLRSGSVTGNSLATLTAPSTTAKSTSDQDILFAPSTAITLAANTTYWVVAEGGGSDIRQTSATGEDDDSADGWSIADTYMVRRTNSTLFSPSTSPLKIQVKGIIWPATPQLTAVPGDGKVVLEIKRHFDSAQATHFEYRVKLATDTTYPTTWTQFAANFHETGELLTIVESLADTTPLTNGTEYAFEVRGVNSVGAGDAATDTATPQANVPAVIGSSVIARGQFLSTARVSDRLHFIVHSISDADSTSFADSGDDRFTYQFDWIRVTTGDTPVETVVHTDQSADRYTSYTLTNADIGSRIKVRMRFRDDRYNQEEFVGGLFPRKGTVQADPTCGPPTYTGGAVQIWTEQIQVLDLDQPDSRRYGVTYSGNTQTFTIGANTYPIDAIYEYTRSDNVNELVFEPGAGPGGGGPETARPPRL